jgi:hypothetical protein
MLVGYDPGRLLVGKFKAAAAEKEKTEDQQKGRGEKPTAGMILVRSHAENLIQGKKARRFSGGLFVTALRPVRISG